MFLSPDSGAAQDFIAAHDTVEVQVDSRASRSLGSATRAVQVLDREMISRSAGRSVSEVLAWGFGVDLMPYSASLMDVGIRGSTFEQVLVLVDGVRMRDGQTGHFNLNLTVPLDQVERIEILRGPAAALYGSDAMAGVINIVTRRDRPSASGLAVVTGSNQLRSIAGSHRQAFEAFSLDLATSRDQGDGHRAGTDFDNRLGRVAVEMVAGESAFRADLAHARRAFGADGFYGAYPAFETTRTTTATLAGQLGVGAIALEPLLRWRRNSDDFILFRDDPARYRNRHSTVQVGADLVGRLPLSEGLAAAAGLHWYEDKVESIALRNHEERTAAGSIELAAEGGDRGTVTVGLRAERAPTGKMLLAPALSGGWSPTPEVHLRSSVGRAYRMPTWTERFYRDPIHEGRSDLTWESAWSADAGVDFSPYSGLRLSGAAFIRKERDLIDWARPSDGTDLIWRTRNVDEATFRGLEAQFELPQLFRTHVRAEGSWISLESSSGEGFFSKYALRPQVETLALIVDRDVLNFLQISFRSARERRSGEDSHFLVDGRAAAVYRGAKVYIDATNLTDADYLDIARHAAPGRSVAVGLEWRR